MTDNEFSNIDDILAEFSSFSSDLITHESQEEKEEKASPAPEYTPGSETPVFDFTPKAPAVEFKDEPEVKAYVPRHKTAEIKSGRPAIPETEVIQPYAPSISAVSPAPAASASVPRKKAAEKAAAPQPKRPVRRNAAPVIEGETRPLYPEAGEPRRATAQSFDPAMLGYSGSTSSDKTQISPVRRKPKAPVSRNDQHAVSPEKPLRTKRSYEKADAPVSKGRRGLLAAAGVICMVLSVFILNWVFLNVHPDSGTITTSTARPKMNLMEKFDNYVNNTASTSLDGLVYIPKIYTIPEEATVAPKPNPALFGSTTDPQEVMELIETAANLLDGQEVVFNPDANFVPGSPIQYYLDDTILAITWQEDINNKLCSCSEVKVAHGSQVRRKLADDTFNSGRQYYASDMAKQCNAIVAINGDFYANRTIGISAYNRELYRFTANDRLESCAFTASGDMLFIHAGELYDEAYTKQYMEENDVVFLISFGPILIENGELCDLSSGYPIGEINHTYSRTGIAQMGPLHYFTMNINYGTGSNGKGYGTAATLSELGQYMYDKGCHHAYTLDGGQTSVLLMNGELVNHVDYGYERLMSDIIYFASAFPEEEAAQ